MARCIYSPGGLSLQAIENDLDLTYGGGATEPVVLFTPGLLWAQSSLSAHVLGLGVTVLFDEDEKAGKVVH
jgi:hypothetical protein